jgi:hypothetical protein
MEASHPSCSNINININMGEPDKHLYVPSKLQLPRPDFAVDSENEDLELWTFRLPTNVPVSSLNNVDIDLNTNTGEFQVGDQAYKIVLGDAVENESFRVLVPAEDDKSDDSNSDDDDDSDNDDEASDKQDFLQPSSLPFARHWNAVTAVPVLSETQLAPREGPPPVDFMRHAYSHVPQRTGLKRRWMPMGVKVEKSAMPAHVTATKPTKTVKTVKEEGSKKSSTLDAIDVNPPTKRIKVEDDQEEAVEAEALMSRSDKKSIKAEKKSAKKAKKEAKKAKKEKRKSK